MNYELTFNLLSMLPGPFWLSLFFLSDKKWAMKAFDVFLVILSFHFAYLALPTVPEILPEIADPKYDVIKGFLGTDLGFLGSWNHMILGDLWIGRWVVFDAKNLGFNGWFRAPFIMVILFFGPLGLASYFIFRMLKKRSIFFFDQSRYN